MPQTDESTDRIAVIGMAGRFPGAHDVDELWSMLREGREGLRRLTPEEMLASGVDRGTVDQDGYVPVKGVLDGADRFDAAFFDLSPRDAELIDPQHRLLLECAWEALEDAGCVPATFSGRVGVFAGSALNTYLLTNVLADPAAVASAGRHQVLQASDKDFLATRVAYKLGLRGPAMTVQTACSTSLTAVHLACQSLLTGECDIALAGGVTVSTPLLQGYLHEAGGIASPDGRCRPFDSEAAGTVPGNGVGLVVLRRLDDALAAGDLVSAVVLGTAVNNDGSLKAGYTAPSVDGQAGVIAEALAVADVDPATIGYVEAHGTATPLGDPVEVAALTQAFRARTDAVGRCGLGSVKGNLGHLDAAAGVAGLIKTVLMLRHRELVPSLHWTRPNPQLELDSSPFAVVADARPWESSPGTPRRAGVSSFGIGGTNVHVVLEEAPERPGPAPAGDDGAVVLRLSGRAPEAVVAGAERLADHLELRPGVSLDAVARTLAHRRGVFEHRAALTARTPDEAVAALRGLTTQRVTAAPARLPRVAFLLPGQGAQHAGMARDLYRSDAGFAREVDRCAGLFADELGLDLRDLVLADGDACEGADERLAQTQTTQPALFLVEHALASWWLARGVRPAALAGHSIGEYVAACLAGVLSLEDAVRVVSARGRLVAAATPGAMLAVPLPEQELVAWARDGVGVAAVNSSRLGVLSGPADAVDDVARRLAAAGVPARRLHTSHAFHSASMDAAVEPLTDVLRGVELHAPAIPFLSNVTGTWITDDEATSPEYWGTHLRRPVRFADAVAALLEEPSVVLLEVGPGSTLTSLARAHDRWTADRLAVTSLPHARRSTDAVEHVRRAEAALWCGGVDVAAPAGGDVVRLPTYAFQRRRFWLEPSEAPTAPPAPVGTADRPRMWAPGWSRLPAGERPAVVAGRHHLVLADDAGFGRELARRLTVEGCAVTLLDRADDPTVPSGRDDVPSLERRFTTVLEEVLAHAPSGLTVLHTGSVDVAPGRLDDDVLAAGHRAGFASLSALGRALARVRPTVPVRVDVVCRGLHDVTGEERLQPELSTLTGVTTVLPQEVAGVRCRVLDVSGPGDLDGAVAAAVTDAVLHPADRSELALRGRHWWVRGFDPLDADPDEPGDAGADATPGAQPAGSRSGAVHLVTGGLGGVGLAIAEHLARHTERPVLVLAGRSPFPARERWDEWLATHPSPDPTSRRIERLRTVEGLGARVQTPRLDVTDLASTTALVRQVRAEHGRLDVVVHAAGAPGGGVLAGRTAADVARVLDPKVRGTLAVDAACADDPPALLLLCSSLTAVLGGFGQADYCAANAFLDAFAHRRRREGAHHVVAVDWGRWEGVGMAEASGVALAADPVGDSTGHPLLRRLPDGDGTREYVTRFSTADSWVVSDHRILGHGLVPGTAYLEIVRAALADRAGGRVLELRDVEFVAPVVVPDGQERAVRTTLRDATDGVRFEVRSREGGADPQRVHATGRATFVDAPVPAPRDLARVRAACRVRETFDSEAQILRRARAERWTDGDLRFSVGPRWRVLDRLEIGDGHVLATLRLPEEFHPDLDVYELHPALLDMAVGVFRVDEEESDYLPSGYGVLRQHAPLTGVVVCHAWAGSPGRGAEGTLTCDLELLDTDGRVLVEIERYAVRRVNDVGALSGLVRRAAAPPVVAARPATALDALVAGMSEAEGAAAFGRVLALERPPAQLVVTTGDLDHLRELAGSLTPEALAAGAITATTARHPRPDLDTPYVAPRGPAESAVAEVWSEVLGIDLVGVDDDFFALGGHSLAAVQIGTLVRERLGRDVDLNAFYTTPTVAHLAGLLAADPGAAPRVTDVIGVADRGDDALEQVRALTDEEVDARLHELLALDGDDHDAVDR